MPRGFTIDETITPLFGETEEEAAIRKRDELFERLDFEKLVAEKDAEAKKRSLTFSVAAVALGGLAAGTMAALAIRSYKQSESVVMPAIYVGVGSATALGATLMLYKRATGKSLFLF